MVLPGTLKNPLDLLTQVECELNLGLTLILRSHAQVEHGFNPINPSLTLLWNPVTEVNM